MQNTGDAPVKRIFVKVFGFTDVERHALNTVFRLSESRPVAYALWTAEAPADAQAALLDGDNWEASLGFVRPADHSFDLFWVGDGAPPSARRVFSRPLQWAQVIDCMDRLYAPDLATAASTSGAAPDLDFDVSAPAALVDFDVSQDFDEDDDADPDTAPMQPEPERTAASGPRVLVVDSKLETRLYLRAKLSIAGFTQVDEATSGADALELMRTNVYWLAFVDMEIGDMRGLTLFRKLKSFDPGIEHLVVTAEGFSPLDLLRNWLAGVRHTLRKPLVPRDVLRLIEALRARNI